MIGKGDAGKATHHPTRLLGNHNVTSKSENNILPKIYNRPTKRMFWFAEIIDNVSAFRHLIVPPN